MGQQLNSSSKVKSPSESDWIELPFLLQQKLAKNFKTMMDKLLLLDPKPGDLT
jgi:hypothetical protein